MSRNVAKRANSVDAVVGTRVRVRRMSLGMSQSSLGEKLGVTFQQVQKYEKGANRIGASRLQAIADALQVPIGFFFDRARENVEPNHLGVLTAEGVRLNRAFIAINDHGTRRQIIDLVRSIANAGDETLQ